MRRCLCQEIEILNHFVFGSGKILPCPNAAEIRRLAMMDVSSEDEPALLFECGEAEHIMLA